MSTLVMMKMAMTVNHLHLYVSPRCTFIVHGVVIVVLVGSTSILVVNPRCVVVYIEVLLHHLVGPLPRTEKATSQNY